MPKREIVGDLKCLFSLSKINIVSNAVGELNGKSCCEASLTFVGTTYIFLVNFRQIFTMAGLERNQR